MVSDEKMLDEAIKLKKYLTPKHQDIVQSMLVYYIDKKKLSEPQHSFLKSIVEAARVFRIYESKEKDDE